MKRWSDLTPGDSVRAPVNVTDDIPSDFLNKYGHDNSADIIGVDILSSPLLYPVDYELSQRRMDECRSTGNKVVSIAATCLLSGLSGSSYAGMHIPKQTVHLSVAYNECEYWCGEVGGSIDKVSEAKSLQLP